MLQLVGFRLLHVCLFYYVYGLLYQSFFLSLIVVVMNNHDVHAISKRILNPSKE